MVGTAGASSGDGCCIFTSVNESVYILVNEHAHEELVAGFVRLQITYT